MTATEIMGIKVFDDRFFTYHTEKNELTADSSELQSASDGSMFSDVTNEHVGFAIHFKGIETPKKFMLTATARGNGNRIKYWLLEPVEIEMIDKRIKVIVSHDKYTGVV